MHPQLERMYNKGMTLIPRQWAGNIDLCRPSLRSCWGGPLNGQHHRRRIVREISGALKVDRVIETGTFRASSTEFFVSVFGTPVETIEIDRRHFVYSTKRLAPESDVRVHLGDSPDVLRRLAASSTAKEETVFIYLDAHWEDHLPLAEELDIIAAGWPRAVVLIDDFQVNGDDGYAYDNYGTAGALTRDYLPASVGGWAMFYPSVDSGGETGARRGSCVLTSPALMLDVPSLRSAGSVS